MQSRRQPCKANEDKTLARWGSGLGSYAVDYTLLHWRFSRPVNGVAVGNYAVASLIGTGFAARQRRSNAFIVD